MSKISEFVFDFEGLGLHRDEEDLVDYDDSDIEMDTGDNKKCLTPEKTKDLQLKAYSSNASQPEESNQEDLHDRDEEQTKDQHETNISASTSPTTKTLQAATLIKSMQGQLLESAFQTSLGLSAPGDVVDARFWANGYDFVLSLKLTGVAEVKTCRFGVNCFRADCTFDHGGADRSTTIAAGQPRKLCSLINTIPGCPKGVNCWFSHQAENVKRSFGLSRTTCQKGPYCFYWHADDVEVAEIAKMAKSKAAETLPKTIVETECSHVPVSSAASADAHSKQQMAGCKRGRDIEDEGESRKSRRVQNDQVRAGERLGQKDFATDAIYAEHTRQARRDSGQNQHRNRGRNGDHKLSVDYYKPTGKQHADATGRKTLLRSRMTRDQGHQKR